jgi:hypothetical protein
MASCCVKAQVFEVVDGYQTPGGKATENVVAGAALGFGSAELTWWLSDKLLGKGTNFAVGTSGNTVDLSYSF